MSNDYEAVLMYGKEFSDVEEAANHIKDKISSSEYIVAIDYGEFPDNLTWCVYNVCVGGYGVLGLVLDKNTVLHDNNSLYFAPNVNDIKLSVDDFLGDGCDVHLFVSVS